MKLGSLFSFILLSPFALLSIPFLSPQFNLSTWFFLGYFFPLSYSPFHSLCIFCLFPPLACRSSIYFFLFYSFFPSLLSLHLPFPSFPFPGSFQSPSDSKKNHHQQQTISLSIFISFPTYYFDIPFLFFIATEKYFITLQQKAI